MAPKHPPGLPINDDPTLESVPTGQEAPMAGNERSKRETVDQGGIPTRPPSDHDMLPASRPTRHGEMVNDDSTLEKEADLMGEKAALPPLRRR
jgi:hypothetical protein